MKFLATREKNLGCSNLVFHVAKSFLTEISQGLLFLLKSPMLFASPMGNLPAKQIGIILKSNFGIHMS